ncbi:MAG: hypothetical protein BWY65_02179 [Firmicutes bacterium ADurb.Bin373]|nr:MAG: hypothetical protein BWY65_02179 [Firmicutes bacterium ADurb.Bin373]
MVTPPESAYVFPDVKPVRYFVIAVSAVNTPCSDDELSHESSPVSEFKILPDTSVVPGATEPAGTAWPSTAISSPCTKAAFGSSPAVCASTSFHAHADKSRSISDALFTGTTIFCCAGFTSPL